VPCLSKCLAILPRNYLGSGKRYPRWSDSKIGPSVAVFFFFGGGGVWIFWIFWIFFGPTNRPPPYFRNKISWQSSPYLLTKYTTHPENPNTGSVTLLANGVTGLAGIVAKWAHRNTGQRGAKRKEKKEEKKAYRIGAPYLPRYIQVVP
jgi:hypothetical protein